MGLLKLDGFEGYGPDGTTDSDATLNRRIGMRWGNIHGYSGSPSLSPGPSSNHPRGSGLNWEVTSYNGAAWYTWFGDKSSIILGFAWRPNANPYGPIFYFRDWSTNVFQLVNTYTGHLRIIDYNTNTVATTVKPLIRFRRWNYLEVKVTFHPTVGSAVVRHNGADVLNVTNQDFGTPATANVLKFAYGVNSQHGDQSLDDMYLIDPATSGVNEFLGPIVVRRLRPMADTATAEFTPSAGSDHYAVVDGDRAEESDYLASSTVTDDELWDYENIPSDINTLKAVSLETAAAVTGSQPKKVTTLCKSGAAAVQELDALTTISNVWEQFDSIEENDPDTGSPWTIAGLNAAQFGVRHKA